ncbi:MAG: type II toxin-antitoxin system ParD family antitoxin [Bradyrhizobium sp.]|uniref:type II toxin-antitoxin system ParD family antitoxin n=1 Tax=Bradyrhizobium sp. TaxID=376 RepID=UPI003D13F84C
MRTSKPITVTLGPMQASLERRLKSGDYDNASEILRAALRALDREEAAIEEHLRAKVAASLADPRKNVPAADVFRHLRAVHSRTLKAAKRGA